MSESQIDLNNNRKKQLGRFLQLMPEQGKQLMGQVTGTYKAGALEKKAKHLMALAIALGVGCRNCVLFHQHAGYDRSGGILEGDRVSR